jgi:hypothetical protein
MDLPFGAPASAQGAPSVQTESSPCAAAITGNSNGSRNREPFELHGGACQGPLLAGDGVANNEIALTVNVNSNSLRMWRRRFGEDGI